ncbi:hypothetical protein SAMN05216490_1438 [Mucilaginibacter mallensis]|uniref:DKNYY family protein n=1 Tax=Mucilaginibacter mallensis TaxID=652787 RepID=A0A1H1THM6_MUCMA|nr:hypothetical protein [Mucilaginibacter mallensis]SDS59466.1 hypothetical protein SAMN05216490_1438 [Mucilaginibacter mallensis]
MLKTYTASLLCVIAVLFAENAALAQTIAADSLNRKQALYANITDNFYRTIGSQSMLYNGKAYEFYDPALKGNAYVFDNASFSPGTVVYDGVLYKDVNMLYDLFKDELVIKLYNSALKITLLKERVSSFDMLDHHFVNIKTDSTSTNSVRSGYYDQLYGGKIQVLARREKSIQTAQGFAGSLDSYFLSSLNYYLYKNGRYYSVSSEGSFLDVLKDKKKELQQFIKANKLKFKKYQREDAMAKVAAYYDQLTD